MNDLIEPEDWANELLSRLERDSPDGIVNQHELAFVIKELEAENVEQPWKDIVIAELRKAQK